MRYRGKLIVLEGLDGAGKSTVAENLAHALRNDGHKVASYSFPGRGSGTLGSHIYNLHHDLGAFDVSSIEPTALQILHIAAHIDSIQRNIVPSLSNTDFVLLDRYWWSTLAYGLASGASAPILEAALGAEKLAWNEIQPASLFVLSRESSTSKTPLSSQRTRIAQQYDGLASKYRSKFPIHVIHNEGTVSSAVSQILEILRRI